MLITGGSSGIGAALAREFAEQVDEFAARVQESRGPIDIVINNAGIPKRRWTWALDAATADVDGFLAGSAASARDRLAATGRTLG